MVEIAAGFYHTCARKSDRTVWCWGANDSDQLGYANTADGTCFGGTQCNPTPTVVKNGAANLLADEISSGANHTCAWTSGGNAWCWGQNANGQLADGTLNSHATPTQAVFPKGVATMALGDDFGCAKLTDGSIWCFGSSYDGQSGTNIVGASTTPVLPALP